MEFWQSFWSIIWWFIWSFVFIAYLMAIFGIFADIFRDRELKGWAKAIWIAFLIFIPFLAAIIYLIVRGGGMARRGAESLQRQQEDANAYIRDVAGGSPSDEIEKAARLRDAGIIQPDEFEKIKARVLA